MIVSGLATASIIDDSIESGIPSVGICTTGSSVDAQHKVELVLPSNVAYRSLIVVLGESTLI